MPSTTPSPCTFIAAQRRLNALLDALRPCPAIAVDTESNSLYAYHERVCLIQFSTPDEDFLVDALAGLDLSPLGEVFANPAQQKVFHAAEQDIAGLKRDFGFRFANLFDTMWAARILGWPRVGLGDLLWEHFGVHSDKRFQRYDWGERPLRPEALTYACLDTHHLLALQEIQRQGLEEMGRTEEAAEVFALLTQTPPAHSPFGPEAFWRVKGVHDLNSTERAVLWEVYCWRDRVAQEQDRPPFKVLSNAVLLALARSRPHSTAGLMAIRGISPYLARRYGASLLAAIALGEKGTPPDPPPCNSRPKEAVMTRHNALRAWRAQVAARRGVDTDVVISNATLWALAERAPQSLEEMEGIEGLGPWKRRTYGPDILRVLHGRRAAERAYRRKR